MDSAQFTIGIHRSASNAYFTFPWKFRIKFVASFHSKFSLLTRLNCAIKSTYSNIIELNLNHDFSQFNTICLPMHLQFVLTLSRINTFHIHSFISMLFFPSSFFKFSISWENCTHFERFDVISWVLLLFFCHFRISSHMFNSQLPSLHCTFYRNGSYARSNSIFFIAM